MEQSGGSQWYKVRRTLLRERSSQLVGQPIRIDDDAELQVSISHLPLPSGCVVVALGDAGGLDDVYDLCAQVAAACLDDDPDVLFVRTASDAGAVAG